MTNRKIHIIGGGTFSYVRNHLALGAPAFGTTARTLSRLCRLECDGTMDVELHLTRMAESSSSLITNDDVATLTRQLVGDPLTKIIFFNPALVDFFGGVWDIPGESYFDKDTFSGKNKRRLDSSRTDLSVKLFPDEKILPRIREHRKDIFLVGFKTTTGATPREQYVAGLNLLKSSSCNLVMANDVVTRNNLIVVPEEAGYYPTADRDTALRELVEMTLLRSQLTFTRSTVVAGEPVLWSSELVPAALRTVVDHCIFRGAYKTFRGVTAGHFAVRLNDRTFLTSRRKTDFNDIRHVGLVKIQTDGPDSVIAYGSKPSVGGQSQRIVFDEHPAYDCIVHFHCERKSTSKVPVISQREFECGSHECGRNTSEGLQSFGNIMAVYLDNHGPNIVFNSSADPAEVIMFIEENFNLQTKTGGYQLNSYYGPTAKSGGAVG